MPTAPRSIAFVIALTTLAAGGAVAQQRAPDTAAVNAAVRAAKATYAEVENALKASRLIEADTEVVCDSLDDYGSRFAFLRDSAGVIRLFDWKGGTDDSGLQLRYYYDAGGRLRFAIGVWANVYR
jgi:hypothetical protein